MGYGTLTPILLLMGFNPIEVIPAVILTSAILSLFAGFLHHGFDNIDFLVKKNPKILTTLISFGIVAIILGALVAVNIPEGILRVYIGLLIIGIGISILMYHKKRPFSYKRLMVFASLASFNKGVYGGGYGPVLAGGQIVSGVEGKHAVGVTALSEGVVSTFGFLAYLLISGGANMNWPLIISLLIGGTLSTPVAVLFVKRFHPKKFRYMVGAVSIVLGLIIVLQMFG